MSESLSAGYFYAKRGAYMELVFAFISGMIGGFIVKYFTRNKETIVELDKETIVELDVEELVSKSFNKSYETRNRWNH